MEMAAASTAMRSSRPSGRATSCARDAQQPRQSYTVRTPARRTACLDDREGSYKLRIQILLLVQCGMHQGIAGLRRHDCDVVAQLCHLRHLWRQRRPRLVRVRSLDRVDYLQTRTYLAPCFSVPP